MAPILKVRRKAGKPKAIVEVRALGRLTQILIEGQVVWDIDPKVKELFFFIVDRCCSKDKTGTARGFGFTAEEAFEALWPGWKKPHATTAFHQAKTQLYQVLRYYGNLGNHELELPKVGSFTEKIGILYNLSDLFGVKYDVEELEEALYLVSLALKDTANEKYEENLRSSWVLAKAKFYGEYGYLYSSELYSRWVLTRASILADQYTNVLVALKESDNN